MIKIGHTGGLNSQLAPNPILGQWSSWDTCGLNSQLAQFQTEAIVKLGHWYLNFQLTPILNWSNGYVGILIA